MATQGYDPMADQDAPLTGLAGVTEGLGLIKAESMALTNDPRFFQDNVINYRLAAFSGLSVVSGLMVQNAMDHIFDMDKNMNPIDFPNGTLQLTSFVILNMVLFFNMLAVYVGVAQPYHTIRLYTGGATGFEAAASYYLDRNIVAWRHFAIRFMLISLPMFVVCQGIRLVVKFDRQNSAGINPPDETPIWASALGYSAGGLWCIMGLILYWIHVKHFDVFRERYEVMQPTQVAQNFVQTMSERARNRGSTKGWLDV